MAGDTRFGFATHFQQGWSTSIMPAIAATGAGWIRDNYLSTDYYYSAAHNAGLKVCVIIGSASEAVNAVTNGWADAIEVLNEPNNQYASQDGPNWESDLVTLTNSISAAVHLAKQGIPVIGLGAQGSEITNMLAMGPTIDGLVYHPYPYTNSQNLAVPEWIYTLDVHLAYDPWVRYLRTKTSLPFWETEWGDWADIAPNTKYPYWAQADFIARRMCQAAGLGVEHSFVYEYQDNGSEDFGITSTGQIQKPSYSVIQRLIGIFSGVKYSGYPITINSFSGVSASDIFAYSCQGPVKTVAAIWIGNHSAETPPAYGVATFTFTDPSPHHNSYVMDAVTGKWTGISGYYHYSQTGNQFTITVPISDHPVMIVLQ